MTKILLTILLFVQGINLSYSQKHILEKPININVTNTPLKEVLKQISEQAHCFFTYNPDFISEKKKITYHTNNTTIFDVLNYIFSDSTLAFSVIDDHVVIYKKEEEHIFLSSSNKTNPNLFEISGRVLNSKTGKSLAFVSIGILNTAIGTVTNENGFFLLKVDKNFADSILFVANLAYETYYIKVKDAISSNNNIKLHENYVSIQEVIIRTRNPIDLINNAIKNIKNNYSQKPVILKSFYREGVVQKNKVLNMSEAILKIYKTPYKATFLNDKIKVEKSRKIINTEFSDTLLIKLKDGLYSSLYIDIVKNPISFFNNENMFKYKYKTRNIVTYGDKQVYVVSFKQKKDASQPLYKGNIYIETQTYAVVACDFEFNFNTIGAKPNFIVKKKRKHKVKTLSAKYHLNYRSVNNVYFLNHVRADLEFKAKKNKQFFYSKYNVFLETVIFDIDTTNIEKFHRKDIERKNKIFVDNHYSYDANFWGNSNFIKPEKPIEDAFEKIKAILK